MSLHEMLLWKAFSMTIGVERIPRRVDEGRESGGLNGWRGMKRGDVVIVERVSGGRARDAEFSAQERLADPS